mmetsp:Transcript_24697/g.33031  ORF Transcript_24697/g.33031 Transcript_24697/m.33031 type:complete len:121 (+) Transcript_24697:706-1068(+)
MDDIIEKLSLLDYETSFCKVWKSKRISRIYFAHPPHFGEDQTQRINYFFNLCYWLMSMNKEKRTGKKNGSFCQLQRLSWEHDGSSDQIAERPEEIWEPGRSQREARDSASGLRGGDMSHR